AGPTAPVGLPTTGHARPPCRERSLPCRRLTLFGTATAGHVVAHDRRPRELALRHDARAGRFLAHARDRGIGKCLFQPRIDLARKGFDPAHRLVVLEKPGLAHDQEMPEAADVVVHLLDLAKDLSGVRANMMPASIALSTVALARLAACWSTAAPRRICACTGVGT